MTSGNGTSASAIGTNTTGAGTIDLATLDLATIDVKACRVGGLTLSTGAVLGGNQHLLGAKDHLGRQVRSADARARCDQGGVIAI